MAKKNELIKLLTEILTTVEAVGLSPTIDILKSRRPLIPEYEAELINFIIAKTCLTFCIPRKELLAGNSRNIRRPARSVCCYFIRKYVHLTQNTIGYLFSNMNQANISRGIRYVEDLDINNKMEQEIYNKKKKIEEEINNYLQQKLQQQ